LPPDPKAKTEQGFGAGRVYWHGRLVPNTRIECLAWLKDRDAIRAIVGSFSGRASRERQSQEREQDVVQRAVANGNLCGAMFLNYRSKISTNKFTINSFQQSDLDIDMARVDVLTAAEEREAELLRQLRIPFNDTRATSQLIVSETKFEVASADADPAQPAMRTHCSMACKRFSIGSRSARTTTMTSVRSKQSTTL